MTSQKHNPRRGWLAPLSAVLFPALLLAALPGRGADTPKVALPQAVLDAEAKRVAAVQKVQPAVVAVMTGGGSGVLISDDGYALTNFHVVEAAHGPYMKCGLADGILYDAVLVGLDKVGDVALIKLMPKKPGDKFPYAKMGDSDKVQAGDWSLAMGNPFLLATDFTPTVTFGLVSGVHRYQYPAGTLLEYTNCIQIDTSINPGNSGGPLFNMDGELIGINGRGSFEKRGRVNSGVGYAISINQIKNFMGQLRAGMDTDHASLGALMKSETEEGALSKVIVGSIIESDAARRGLDVDDQLVSFAGQPMFTVNQFKNTLGLFPRGWRVPLVYRRENDKKDVEKKEILVRLMGVQRREIGEKPGEAPPGPAPGPGPMPRPGGGPPPVQPGDAAGKYEAKTGFANFYYNKVERDRLLGLFAKHGDFSKVQGDWKLRAGGLLYNGDARGKRMLAELTVKHKGAKNGTDDVVQAIIDGLDYNLEPLHVGEKEDTFFDPPGSGGLLLAMFQYRQLLAYGIKGFVGGEFSHGGIEPFYPPLPSGEKADYNKLRVDCEVIRTTYAGMPAKWYFSTKEDETRGQLLGFEVWPDREKDPCEVYLADYKDVDGRKLPHRIEVRFGDKTYAVLNVNTWKLDTAK